MVIQGTAIPNLMIEVAGIMICIFAQILIGFGMSLYGAGRRLMINAFSMMLIYNLCLLLLEFTQIDSIPSPGILVFLLGTGTYIFPVITAYLVSLYIVHVISGNDREYRKGFRALRAFSILAVLALLMVSISGKLVLVDAEGNFSYGSASMLGYVLILIYMVLDVVLLIIYGSILTHRQRYSIMTYLILPILSIFIRGFFPGVYLVALSSCISMMIMLVLIMREQSDILRKQERDNEQLKVDLMLSQIQPHFLFNVLYVIQEICLVDAETASQAISDFSRYLRHNMDSISINTPISFTEELEHVRHYVSLQQLRFGDALKVEYDLGPDDFKIPTLTLQPLVENAIRYGVRKSEEGAGTVTIRTIRTEGYYKIHVIDDGPGFVPDKEPEDGLSHTGIKNVRERLRRVCGGELIIESGQGKGTDAVILIPRDENTPSNQT